jgi:NitT/TauT family transport system substrate-binding protein
MRRVQWVIAFLALTALIAGCGGDDDDGGDGAGGGGKAKTAKVSLRLNWVIAGNHAPFYLAQQKGYWKSCGLDVTMTAGKGSSDTATLVASGSQDFGISDAVSVIAGRSRGLPIKSIGVLYQTNPSAIVSKKDAGITTLDDVKGKTWGAVPGGSPYLLLKALFKQNNVTGVKEASVPAPGIAQLKTGQVDFITQFANEVKKIDPDPEKNLNVLPFKDLGQDIYGLTLITTEDRISKSPDQVSCFQEGVKKGFQEARANPAAALDVLQKASPETASNRDVQQSLLDGAFEYTGSELLAQDPAKWEATQKVLVQAKLVKSTSDPQTFFTQPSS